MLKIYFQIEKVKLSVYFYPSKYKIDLTYILLQPNLPSNENATGYKTGATLERRYCIMELIKKRKRPFSNNNAI